MHLLTIVHNDLGIRFNVRLIRKGDRYGLLDKLVHASDDPMVEFYDARYPHTDYGQFVARYNVETLLPNDGPWSIPEGRGLVLDGGVLEWRIDAGNLTEVRRALRATGTLSGQEVHAE